MTETPTGKLSPQPWMETPPVKAVVAALTAAGAEVRFVGGCVRDALARRPVKDVDIATPTPPEEVMTLLRKAGLKAVPTGLAHGTVTAVADGMPFEVTTLRRDVETDGRHATVAFTDDWVADAARRDFTFNALSATPDGDVFDPFGGIDDLAHGRVRFVGRPGDRIDEDVLRLLRFFRFFAHYGNPPADAEGLAACRARAKLLPTLSGERVRQEMLRLLEAPAAAEVIALMRGERILEHVLPEAGNVGGLRGLVWLESKAIRLDAVTVDPIRRLAALLRAGDGGADAVAARLRLSNREKARLRAMTETAETLTADLEDDDIRRALHRNGPDALRDLVLLSWAERTAAPGRLGSDENGRWLSMLTAAVTWGPLEFPLSGRDARALGVPSGPEVGRLLSRVKGWWMDGGCRADRAACLERLEQHVTPEPDSR